MKHIKSPLLLILCLTALAAASEELHPTFNGKRLGASLSGVPWPATLLKDFQSGFENRILVRLALLSDNSPAMKSEVLIIEKYDLWSELFTIRSLVNSKPEAMKSFASINEAFTYATTLRVTDAFMLADMSQNRTMTLQADILINPIERERIEQVTRWVAENSTPATPRPPGMNAPLTTRPNGLFNSIYGQYVRGADMAAPWKITIISKPFVVAANKE